MEQDFYINTLVVKVASRCNLNCTYCYMYNKGDDTYLQQPKVMPDEVIDSLATKVVKHCLLHELDTFGIVLHGGEPLLAGMEKIRYFVETFRAKAAPHPVEIKFTLQTNGLLLTKEWCLFLSEYNIGLGISIDGTKEVNDRHRIDHAGRGSYDQIIRAIATANQYYSVRAPGMLSVLDINTDPVVLLRHHLSIGARTIDFLLPDANYDHLPPQPVSGPFVGSDTPYGDWLVALYEAIKELPDDERPQVKLFFNLIAKFLGADIASDIIGDDQNHVLVIETNGDIEPIDMLKICGNGFTKGNVNVLNNDLDDAARLKLAALYYYSHSTLCAQCTTCPIYSLCGSGFIVHRYAQKNGFDNPTVYCKDYIRFITHIQSDMVSALPVEMQSTEIVESISYEEVIDSLQI